MSADPREAEILPHLYGYTICDCCNGARPRLDALRSYLAALTDAQLSALGLTRRREGQPAEGWPHGVCPDCGQKVGRHACYRGVVEPPLASPREAPEGDKDDGSAAGDTAGSTGVSAVPSGSALGSLPLTPEAPGAGEKCPDCGGSGRPWDSAGNQLNRTCLSCRGTGTARPNARPAEVARRFTDSDKLAAAEQTIAALKREAAVSNEHWEQVAVIADLIAQVAELELKLHNAADECQDYATRAETAETQIAELEQRLHMADTIAANAISVEMVLDLRKQSKEESYYEVAVRMDRRIEELEELLREATGCDLTDWNDELNVRIRDALADRATRKEAVGLQRVERCPCGEGNPGSYEGPLRDCPVHGEPNPHLAPERVEELRECTEEDLNTARYNKQLGPILLCETTLALIEHYENTKEPGDP